MNRQSLATNSRRLVAGVLTLAAAVFGTGLGGCAGNNDLIEANRALTDRNQALVQENESLRNANAALQSGLASRDKLIADQKRIIDDLLAGKISLEQALAQLGDQIGGMRFGELDPQTDAALRQLAAQYPDLLEYDPERGMLRFKADLTFDSGSDAVKPAARDTLRQLAGILNSDTAVGYDVRIVGHTDAQRVRQVAGRRFINNIELSAFRAISVRNVLNEGGVNPGRMEIAGRGEFDPMVPNNMPSGNTAQNRRVEMFLVKPLVRRDLGAVPADTGAAPAPAPAPARNNEDFMK